MKAKVVTKIAYISGFVWILSLFAFSLAIVVGTDFFKSTVDNTTFGNSDSFMKIILFSIFVGILSFLVMCVSLISVMFSKNKNNLKDKKFLKRRDIVSILTFVGLLLLLITLGYANYHQDNLISAQRKQNYNYLATTSPIRTIPPTATKNPNPTSKPNTYVDPDPIIDCNINANCGGGTRKMKKSECSQSTCCQIGNGWYMYPTKPICTQAQNNYYSSKSTGSVTNYPLCTVYYPILGYSQTYSYISPETCRSWQNQANTNNPVTITPTYQPVATLAPVPQYRDYNDPVCESVRNKWEEIKSAIGPLDYTNPNYSSSADMMRDYLYWKDQVNAEYKSNMCTGYLD